MAKGAQKSELQLAADRVREMTKAVESTEKDLKVCEDENTEARIRFEETIRHLRDTTDMLYAKRCKLEREVDTVRSIVGLGACPAPY